MMRNLVCLVLFACLAILTGAWSAGPPDQAKSVKTPPAAKPVAPAGKLSPAEKLLLRVDFSGIDDPKMNLLDALEKLTKEHGLVFDVNEKAFKYEMLNDVLKQEVANPNAIPPMKARLALVLKKILARIPTPSGATWLVRRDRIEITTRQFLEWEVYRDGSPDFLLPAGEFGEQPAEQYAGPRLPLVHPDFRKVPLSDALETLADATDFNIVLDPSLDEKKAATPVALKALNLPLDTAVLLLAGMAGLQFVQLDNVLFVTTPDRAVALKKAHALRRPTKKENESDEDRLLKKEEELTDRIGKKALEDRSGTPKAP